MADLTKMVDSWRIKVMGDYGWQTNKQSPLYNLLKAMAKQIEANEAEIERLKTRLATCQSIQDDTVLSPAEQLRYDQADERRT